MAISLITAPPDYAFTGQDIIVDFQSTFFIIAQSTIELKFSGLPNVDEAITISWEGNSVTMTAKASPDSSGNQFPSNGSPLKDYVDMVAEAFLQNETFLQNASVNRSSYTNKESVFLRFPVNEIVTIQQSSTLSNCTVIITNFAGLTHDNLRALVRVYQDNKYKGALHAIYNTTNLRAEVNLAELLDLAPHPPDEATISGAYTFGIADKAFGSYYFRHADKYGYPAVAEALQKSATSYVVAGAVARDSTNDFFAPLREIVCHNYKTVGSVLFPKIVTVEQPDWFYYFTKTDLSNQRIHAVVTWSDGTIEQKVINNDISLAANKMYWFPSGYAQCGLDTLSNGNEIITSYRFAIGNLDIPGEVDSFTPMVEVHYEIDLDFGRDWNTYLLCFNGVGGCESVGFRGKTQREIEVKSKNIELADSTQKNFRPRTRRRLELNTGYFDAPYIEHFQQLLTGELWLIDMNRSHFLPVRLLIGSVDLPSDDNDPEMHALTFEVEYAQEEQSYNDY